MTKKGISYSIIRLNATDTGYGVVDDDKGAIVHLNGLAMRLTRERANAVASLLNAQARENDKVSDD